MLDKRKSRKGSIDKAMKYGHCHLGSHFLWNPFPFSSAQDVVKAFSHYSFAAHCGTKQTFNVNRWLPSSRLQLIAKSHINKAAAVARPEIKTFLEDSKQHQNLGFLWVKNYLVVHGSCQKSEHSNVSTNIYHSKGAVPAKNILVIWHHMRLPPSRVQQVVRHILVSPSLVQTHLQGHKKHDIHSVNEPFWHDLYTLD